VATTAKFAGASSDASEVCRVHDGISMVYPASFYSQPEMKGQYSSPAGWRSAKQTAFFTAQLGMVKNGPPFSPRTQEL